MSTQKIPVFDNGMQVTAIADCIVAVRKIGGMTHIIFAETRPSVFEYSPDDGSCRNERVPSVRLAIPNEAVNGLMLAIMSGEVAPSEITDRDVRRDH